MSLTNQEVLELVKNAKKNVKSLTHISNKADLTFEDKVKISLCKHFVKYMNEKRISLTALSAELKLPKSRVSEIVNYKIKKFTLNKLMINMFKLAELSPKTSEFLAFIEGAFEVPQMPVNDTKKLTKQMRDIKIHGNQSPYLRA